MGVETCGQPTEIVYVRPLLFKGGVLFSDLELLAAASGPDLTVSILTGKVLPEIHKLNQTYQFPIKEDPLFDKAYLEKNKGILDRVLAGNGENKVLLFSNQFSGVHEEFASASVDCSVRGNTLFRLHDPLGMTDVFSQTPKDTPVQPISNVLANHVKKHNPDVTITIIPPCFDFSRFEEARKKRDVLRQEMNIAPEEVVIFQPTRAVGNKRIDKAIHLAAGIQKAYGDKRNVRLIVAGGNEVASATGAVKGKDLKQIADKLGFRGLIIANGLDHMKEVPDMYAVSDLTTYMSDFEGMGLVPAESVAAEVPLVTTNYPTSDGTPNFEKEFGGLACIQAELSEDPHVENSVILQSIDAIEHPAEWAEKHTDNLQIVSKFDIRRAIPIFKEVVERTIQQ